MCHRLADRFPGLSSILAPADFYRPGHVVVWQMPGDRLGRGEPVDPVALTSALASAGKLTSAGGPVYVSGLAQAGVPAATWHAEEVKKTALLRAARALGLRLMQETAAPGAEPSKLAALADVRTGRPPGPPMPSSGRSSPKPGGGGVPGAFRSRTDPSGVRPPDAQQPGAHATGGGLHPPRSERAPGHSPTAHGRPGARVKPPACGECAGGGLDQTGDYFFFLYWAPRFSRTRTEMWIGVPSKPNSSRRRRSMKRR